MEFDKKTVEVLQSKKQPCFDFEKLEQEELYDGYYAIVTCEREMSDQKIIDTYRGLWEIEETFKITKETLEASLVYVSREDRIGAHFLSCFIALVIIRLLQKKTKRQYSAERIIEYLNRISCSNEQDNLYLFNYRREVSDVIGETLGIDFPLKRLRFSEIKNILAAAKNETVPYIFLKADKGRKPLIHKVCGLLSHIFAIKVKDASRSAKEAVSRSADPGICRREANYHYHL